jgi:tetratricopeptide (TPR) repeat protein
MVSGTVAPVGGGFLITASLMRTDSALTLTSVQVAADGPSALLGAIDGLARELRSRIGESLRAVAQAPALQDATTSSLAALREFTRGVELGDVQGKFTEGAEHLRAAVREDSTFASAWRKLAVYVFNMDGLRSEVLHAASQAYRFRDHVAGVEQAQVDAYYLEQVNTRAASRVYAEHAGLSQNNQVSLLRTLGRLDASDSVVVKELAESSAGRRTRIIQLYVQLMGIKVARQRLAEARAGQTEMERYFPSAYYTDLSRLWLTWATGGADSLPRASVEAARSPIAATRALGAKVDASLAAMRGQLRRFRTLAAHADALGDSARSGADPVGTAIGIVLASALHRQQLADGVRALDSVRAALTERSADPLDRHDLDYADAYARLGRPELAQPLLAGFARSASRDAKLARWADWQLAQGEVALAEGKAAVALAAFRNAALADSGRLESQVSARWHERLARAFDAIGQRDSAVVHYEDVRSRRDAGAYERAGLILPEGLRRLGVLYQEAGDLTRARQCFEEFVALWRDADAELQPQVADVRSRLAALPRR